MILAIALALTTLQDGGGPPPSAAVAVRAELRSVAPRTRITGSLRPAHNAKLTARETGAIDSVVPPVGTLVAAGEVLVTLDDARLIAQQQMIDARAAEAEATLQGALADEADAQTDLSSLEAALERKAISEREVRSARSRLRITTAQVAASRAQSLALEAEKHLIEIRIADAVVRAPFAGAVVERYAETGEWVVPGTPVLRLVSTYELEAWFDAPERLLVHAGKVEASLSATVDALDRTETASDPRIVPEVDRMSRTFRVIASVQSKAPVQPGATQAAPDEPDRKPQLAPGMSISTWFPSGDRTASIVVPKNALVYRPSGVTVTVVKGAPEEDATGAGETLTGAAVTLPVEIAFELESEVVLKPGPIAEGDVIVVEGNERLFPGATVSAKIRATETQAPNEKVPAEKAPADKEEHK